MSKRVFRPKLEVADIIRRHGEAWRATNSAHVNLAQRRVMTAIDSDCGTKLARIRPWARRSASQVASLMSVSPGPSSRARH